MKTGIGREVTESRLFGPHMLESPYPIYDRLRAERPVFWDDLLNAWIVTRHEDVTAVLKDGRFSSERVRPTVDAKYPNPKYRPLFETLALTMVNRDDPDHARLRKLVNHAFQRTEVSRWAPRIRAIVDELLDGLMAEATGEPSKGSGGAPLPGSGSSIRRGIRPVDFVHRFAVPLPVRVISEIVGIPEDDRVAVKSWCDDFAQVALNFYAHLSTEQLDQGLAGVTAFRDYLAEKAARHRANPPAEAPHPDGDSDRLAPGETLFGHLVHAEQDDHRLSPDELLANTLLLLSAGNETTTSLLSNGLLALLRHPAEMERLRADPSLIPAAVDEFLRHDPPVQFLGRLASEDIDLHGTTIAKGQMTVVVMAAANRDPAIFTAPGGLDVGRYAQSGEDKAGHHLSFGHGRHLCPGMQLARLEAEIAFERLLARIDEIGLAADDLAHQPNFNMRCPMRLPVTLRPGTPVAVPAST